MLDGVFLRHIKHEIEEKLIGGRVDKIHQPNKDEIVVMFRTREAAFRLLLSARANNPRVNFIDEGLENPKQPPMLCMLLRKRIQGAKLIEIRQPELERVLHFDFDAINDLGDRVVLTLTVEIMGKYSNIILTEEGRIVDALKRVNAEMTSQRLVQPGMEYQLPPPQDKLSILLAKSSDIISAVRALPKEQELSKALMATIQGISPIVARELTYEISHGADITNKTMTEEQEFRLGFFYQKLKETVEATSGKPFLVIDKSQKPIDFSFMEPHFYETAAVVKELNSFSELLEAFYKERDKLERMKVKEQDLLKLIGNLSERIARKISNQRVEIEKSKDREELKVNGDLISANLYSIEKGATSTTLLNFYDENQQDKTIKLDPALTASQNAQKYYKDYRKAKTAEVKLQEQIELAEEELRYVDSVFEMLTLVDSEKELNEIKAELVEQGYVKSSKTRKEKQQKLVEPATVSVADGFTAMVGKNNKQNDRLTLKIAKKQDMWFHTKNIPGSHVVLITDGKEPTKKAMQDAANLAAHYSRGREAEQVAVDYTLVKNVAKPQGSKPGMVIYNNFKTIFANPFEAIKPE